MQKDERYAAAVEDGKSSISSSDGDDALEVVGQQAQSFDPAIERRVKRKTDLWLLIGMFTGYGIVYYDKAILGSAVLFGMSTDLKLSVTTNGVTDTSRLSWASSIFYFGMLSGLYPFSFALQRFGTKILGPTVLLWAIVCAATAGVTTFEGLYAQRFFLGFTEAIIPTCFQTIISTYYTQRENTLRQSWWFSSTGLWTIIGGAFNYGFAQVSTTAALKRWQYVYIFAGGLTFLFGLWTFILPTSPVTAWFFTAEERIVAVERLRRGQMGVHNGRIKFYQLKESLLDIKTYLIFIMMMSAYTVNGAVSAFGPLIVSTFGYSTLQSIVFQFPLGALVFIFILLTGFLSTIIPNIRIILLVLCCLPVIAGCAIIWKSTWSFQAAAPVVGYTIIGFFGPVVSLIISVGMANVAGSTKKSFMAANIFTAYCVGYVLSTIFITCVMTNFTQQYRWSTTDSLPK